MEGLDQLRSLIREMIEEQSLDEFSAVGGGAPSGPVGKFGFTLPLGASSKKRKRRKNKSESIRESLSGMTVGNTDFTFHNHFRYPAMDDSYHADEDWYYYDGVECLAKSFGDSKNPFGENRNKGIQRSIRFLQGDLKYPHEA